MAAFPSVEWFDDVRNIFNNEESFRGGGGGQCNCVAGVKVGNEIFVLTFEGFECAGARRASLCDLDEVDFYLDMEILEWRAMIENIRQNGHAGLGYTLNTLDLDRADRLATSVHGDQYREDLFFRYNQTLQYFFDASSRIATEFAR